MNPLSKYKSKSSIIGITSIILVPSIIAAFSKGSFLDFGKVVFAMIYMLSIFIIPALLIDTRKWMKIRNNPEYLYKDVMQNGCSKSLAKLECLANKGNMEAAYFYAVAHCVENSVAPYDGDKAFYWATKSAQKGYGYAQALLGELYQKGIGTDIDYQKAVYWLEESVKQNIYEGEYCLFQCYKQGGYGIEQDLHKAFQHLKQHARRTNNVVSKFAVAMWLFEGTGVEENQEEAFKWFKEVANTTHVQEIYDSDYDVIGFWHQIIPENVIICSYYNLACCYNSGFGTPKDEKAADYWIKKYDEAIREKEEYAELDEKGRQKFFMDKTKDFR